MEKLRARYPWFDHLARAGGRYQDTTGDFLAAGATYFSILAIFPLLMIGFAVAGFVFTASPDLLSEVKGHITDSVQGDAAGQLTRLIDQAIASRTSVGIIGLVLALYSGLGWMANLRLALTRQWGSVPSPGQLVRTKLSDLGALLGLFVALAASFGLSALAGSRLPVLIVDALHIADVPGISVVIRAVSMVMSLIGSVLLFTWIIARLPRIRLPFRNAVKAGALSGMVFELFKYVATFYLAGVTNGPAGATFGPIIGIMVFAFLTTRIILFATAWAATDEANARFTQAELPAAVTVSPKVTVRREPSAGSLALAAGVGAVLVAVGARLRRSGVRR
ncbi:inner membrane protein YhjD [Williamsia sp. CHRR-6]|nr:inner membrane protein YhjD [Williamsia sp. CHRR-6]